MTHWPHGPLHKFDSAGTFIVTAGTYRRAPRFCSAELLNRLQMRLFFLAERYESSLQAWAIFPNHYHWVAAFARPENLRKLVRHFHSESARDLNSRQNTPGRQVWYQYWDSRITHQRSYLARLRYVHTNAVHHGLVRNATNYPWCSAAWFQRTSSAAFRNTVMTFPIEKISVSDDFHVAPSDIGDPK